MTTIEYIKHVLSLQRTLASTTPTDKAGRYYLVSLLKTFSSVIDKRLKSLEGELRKDAENGELETSQTTSWRDSRVGDIIARRYSDKEDITTEVQGADIEALKRLLGAKGIQHRMAISETADISKLNFLVENGFLTEDELNTVLYRSNVVKKTSGKFTILESGPLSGIRDANIDVLEFMVSELEIKESQPVFQSLPAKADAKDEAIEAVEVLTCS